MGGAAWATLAGWLYIRRGVEIVISTILLNFVAVQLLGYAVSGPLQEAKRTVPQTDLLPKALLLPKFDRQLDLNAGVILAIVLAVALAIFLYRTATGFRLRLVGENPRVATVNYIPADRVQLRAMALSGGLCGLAGGVEYLGLVGQLGTTFPQQWGFLGIPVALLGGLNPITTMFSAFFFGALFAGTDNLARFSPSGTTIVYVIQAAAVLAYVALNRKKNVAAAEEG
jgi:simple sugar transport system permease protein